MPEKVHLDRRKNVSSDEATLRVGCDRQREAEMKTVNGEMKGLAIMTVCLFYTLVLLGLVSAGHGIFLFLRILRLVSSKKVGGHQFLIYK